MAKGRRILCWTLGIAALILILGLFASRLLLDEERLKTLASDKAQTIFARQVNMEELSLRLFPIPALHARNLTLSNPAWAKNPHLLRAESATARLELLPLLQRQVVISTLSIDGLSLNLEISAKGEKNWDIRQASPGKNGESPIVPFNPLNLTSLELKNAHVRYVTDSSPVREWLVKEFTAQAEAGWRNATIEASILRDAFRMQAKAKLDDLSGIGRKGEVSKGDIELTWGEARLSITGLIPLEPSLQNHQVKARFESDSLKDIFGFFNIQDGNMAKIAPIKASVELDEAKGMINIDHLALQIGSLQMAGSAQVNRLEIKPVYQAKLAVDRMDWAQAMLDIGRPVLPPLPPGQLFRDNPFAWGLISFMQKAEGRIDLHIKRLISRSGIELKDLRAKMDVNEQRFNIEAFSFAALDGSVKGKLRLNGPRKTAMLHLETENILLSQWLAERESKIPMTGGPMRIIADVSASGRSMKDLASSITGPVSISIGPAKLYSKRIQQAEGWLTGLFPVFSESSADHINLACIGANFPFRAGRAEAEPIVGIRSDVSQLLTTGYIDLKKETMDLRGKVRARSGVNLGIANIAGSDLKIAGQAAKPEIGLDPAATPGALARIGAAILTSGVSLIATAIWDAANPASDPCQITLNAHKRQKAQNKTEESISAKDD